MAFDEGLAHRLRELFEDERSITEKKMFGGVCFLHRGNMACGIVGEELMLRVGPMPRKSV
jgi:TfoX/Sxy family transcriptional regulator of competence genes